MLPVFNFRILLSWYNFVDLISYILLPGASISDWLIVGLDWLESLNDESRALLLRVPHHQPTSGQALLNSPER